MTKARHLTTLGYCAAALLLFVWVYAFRADTLGDDAAIYFRYALNLVEGYGLVYNPNEYYESNTNFLWTLLLTPPFMVGATSIDTLTIYLQALGAAIAVAVFACVFVLARRVIDTKSACLAVLLLATHWTFVTVATSGLAAHLPPLFAALALCLCWQWATTQSRLRAFGIGLCLSLLLLTRLDAALFFGICWLAVSVVFYKCGDEKARAWKTDWLLACALPLLVFAIFLGWKLYYYGDILPATYYAKAGFQIPDFYNFIQRGGQYLLDYFNAYGLWFVLPLCFIAAKKLWQQQLRINFVAAVLLAACALMTLAQFAYMFRIGGGYFGWFRFMATSAPFLFITIAWVLSNLRWQWRALAAAVLIGFSGAHAWQYKSVEGSSVEREWQVAGIALHQLFNKDFGDYSPDIKIATANGGWLPFASRLHTLEMHGWADTRIFEEGNHVVLDKSFPGHQFSASPKFLLEQGVHILINWNWFVPSDAAKLQAIQMQLKPTINAATFPTNSQLVVIPVGEARALITLYINRSKRLDAFFAERGIAVYDILSQEEQAARAGINNH